MDRDDELHEDLRPRDDNPEGISRFEIAARTWAAQERTVAGIRALAEQDDIATELVEAVEEAVRRQDYGEYLEAIGAFLQALREARGSGEEGG